MKNKFKTFLVVSVIVVCCYLFIGAIDVFIDTKSKKEELFVITTAINYSEITKSSTRGKLTRRVKSNSVQRLSIKLDNIIFFSHIFANIYHPNYVFQQKQHAHRSILWAVNFPKFTPRSWRDVMINKIKIRRSSPPKDLGKSYMWSQGIQSGDIIRIVDVWGHLIKFKKNYMPLLLYKGSKKQLREFLPGLKEIVAYTKANIEVNYDQLDEYDQEILTNIDKELWGIEEESRE